MFLTYRYRIKDRASSARRSLEKQASAVNLIWNFCVETDRKATDQWRSGRNVKRPSAFDLGQLCRGITRDLGIHSDTVDAVCQRFASARQATFPKTPRFRSRKRNLLWIPVSNFWRSAKLDDGVLTFRRRRYYLWYSRPLPEGCKPKSWNLSCDSRGRWYVNIQVEVDDGERRDGHSVGIDLGLKTLATLSNGEKVEMPAFYRNAEANLARYQRYGLKRRARSLAAKVANQRKDHLHKASSRIVRDFAHIVIGDVSPSILSKTRMAKSIHDAGWSMLRHMILYKAMKLGSYAEIVSERHSSVTCSACNARSGPKGIAGLRVRDWVCEGCGSAHDRDANAARNILLGAERRPLAEEITRFQAA